jgi:hypothetical protein
MARLMTSINQIEGGDILKSGDVTSVFGFEILGYDGKRMNLSGIGKLTLSNDETVALYQDVTVKKWVVLILNGQCSSYWHLLP